LAQLFFKNGVILVYNADAVPTTTFYPMC